MEKKIKGIKRNHILVNWSFDQGEHSLPLVALVKSIKPEVNTPRTKLVKRYYEFADVNLLISPARQEISCIQCLHDLKKPVSLDLEKHIFLLCIVLSSLEET